MQIAAIFAAALLSTHAAHAQLATSVSTDDLIRQLRPSTSGATRGIRPAMPVQPEAMQAPAHIVHPAIAAPRPAVSARAPAPPAATTPADAQGTASLTVEFETGSDRLTPAAMRLLDRLGRAISGPELQAYKFNVIGHTDTVGRADLNQTLSERRAAAVTAYIAAHYGVDRARLVAVGKGQSEPLVPTADNVDEPRNRRVQVVNLGI